MAYSSERNQCLTLKSLAGPDAASFLQGYVTCDVESINSETAVPMAFTSLKGRVIANGWMFGSPAEVNFIVHQSVVDALDAHLSKYLVFSKSTITEGERLIVGFSTSGSTGTVLEPFDWLVEAFPQNAYSHDQPALLDAAVTQELAIVTKDTADRFLPQMLGLTLFQTVNFNKGCYLGQEIIARAEHRGVIKRRLRRYSWAGEKPNPGQEFDQSGAAGIVIAANDAHALLVSSSDNAVLTDAHCELTLVEGN